MSLNVLVTGGGGFIGSAVARGALARGWKVRVLDNFLTGFEDNVPDEADLYRGDLREPKDVAAACEGIDIVLHQAAVRSVPKSVDDPILTNECNVTGTLNLLVAAKAAGVKRLVYASSSSVYGDSNDEVNREDARQDPRSPYAVSKLAGECYCRAWTSLVGLSTVSLRYFNVFGPGQRPESKYSAVFPGFVSALMKGEAPELHWDGEQTRDFTYIDDVVAANLAAAEAGEEADGEVVNIASGSPKSVNETLKAVSDAVGTWIEPRRLPKRAGDVRRTHADISRAKELLGWTPQAGWEEAVRATVAWFSERQ
ncbi:MAG TPA: NAD-dependent epimerase/dehydratase family protein [Actinomycetota bacterium]|nr:NAD-dependent epimerase/dehydratase family protein [Actinomycetota bacterium]